MAAGRVLVIEGDEWEAALLRKFLKEADYAVTLAAGAREGLEQARVSGPDCVLCDAVLPDIDGFWVARRLRMEPGKIATTPLIMLTGSEDREGRWQSLSMGADACLTRPYTAEEVAAQVGALVGMVERIRRTERARWEAQPGSRTSDALQGDLAQLSVSTTLSILELERRTGSLRVTSDRGEVVLELAEGALVRASLGGRPRDPVATLREVLGWRKGRFGFYPSSLPPPAGERLSLGALMLEALRLEDEGSPLRSF